MSGHRSPSSLASAFLFEFAARNRPSIFRHRFRIDLSLQIGSHNRISFKQEVISNIERDVGKQLEPTTKSRDLSFDGFNGRYNDSGPETAEPVRQRLSLFW
jgi:hypothetical protein